MAKLPTRQDLGPLPIDGSRRPIATAHVPDSRGVAVGLQHLGGAIAGVGEKFDAALREQERLESAAAIADLTKMSLDLDTKYLDDNDYTSRTERYMGDFDKGVEGLAGSIKSDRVRNKVLLEAGEMAARKQLSYTKRSMDDGNSDALARLQQENEYRISRAAGLNDDQFNEQVIGGQERIRSLSGGRGPISSQRAEILARKFATDMANARVNDAILAAKRGDESRLDALQRDLETAQSLPGYGGSSAPASLRDEVKKFEGFNPRAYGDFKQTSIGYGTRAKFPGEVITRDEAERRLDAELQNAAEIVDSVNPNLPPGARAAMISLTYNAGGGWADAGLGNAIRNNDMETAKKLFVQYTKAGGEDHPALMKRRAQEVQWFDESTGKFGATAQTALPGQSDATAMGPPTAAQYMSTADRQRALAKIDAARKNIAIDDERQARIEERLAKKASDDEETKILQDATGERPTVTAQNIAANTKLTREAKERMIKFVANPPGLEPSAGISHTNTADLLDLMRRPESDPNRINNVNPIYDAYLKNKINRADFKFAIDEFTQMRGPEGEKFEKEKTDFLNAHKRVLDKSTLIKQDESGAQAFYLFQSDLRRKVSEYRAAGKDPYVLLTPGTSEYLGAPENIARYAPPLQTQIGNQVQKVRPSAGTSSRFNEVYGGGAAARALPEPRKPGESISDYLKRTGG